MGDQTLTQRRLADGVTAKALDSIKVTLAPTQQGIQLLP